MIADEHGHRWLMLLGVHVTAEQAEQVWEDHEPLEDGVEVCMGHSALGCLRCGQPWSRAHGEPCEAGDPRDAMQELLEQAVEGFMARHQAESRLARERARRLPSPQPRTVRGPL